MMSHRQRSNSQRDRRRESGAEACCPRSTIAVPDPSRVLEKRRSAFHRTGERSPNQSTCCSEQIVGAHIHAGEPAGGAIEKGNLLVAPSVRSPFTMTRSLWELPPMRSLISPERERDPVVSVEKALEPPRGCSVGERQPAQNPRRPRGNDDCPGATVKPPERFCDV
jgi:hypothetical protein